MRAIGRAMYDVISADGTVQDLIGTHGGAPAVFDQDSAPSDYTQGLAQVEPYVVMPGAIDHDPELDLDGLEGVTMAVLIYGPGTATVEPLAEAVAAALEWGLPEANVEGVILHGVEVSGPTAIEPTERSVGRTVQVEVEFTRS